jgi:hypothetical protein
MTRKFLAAAVVATQLFGGAAIAGDWIFEAAPYSRSATSGKRVEQYQRAKKPKLVPYSKYFSEDGPSPNIPNWYYREELGYPGYGGYGETPNYTPLPNLQLGPIAF